MYAFSEEVCTAIGHYVYRLIDPRNGETFYVGRGQGNRVFQHAAGELSLPEKEDNTRGRKLSRIRQIRNAGLEVIHVIHRHDIFEDAVAEVEAALIDAFPGLTNEQGGEGSGDRGPMNHSQITEKYGLPPLEVRPDDRLLLVNINAIEDRSDATAIYEQVRFAWRLNPDRAKAARHVLAVVRGVVIGAFEPQQWLSATPENFPNHARAGHEPTGRYGFVGRKASDQDWERFVGLRGRRIVQPELRHVQNPIRYWGLAGGQPGA